MWGSPNGVRAPREAPTQHKFKVQMYGFSIENLVQHEKSEPCLKIDFDNFRIFKTDHDANTTDPEWGFKAGFWFTMHYLEKLREKKLQVHVMNKTNSAQPFASASIDLQTVACGPAYLKLNLTDKRGNPCGTLKFVCVMKMMSEITVLFRDLRLTMQGCEAPARLNVYISLQDDKDDMEKKLAHSIDGTWEGPYSLSFETTLADLLKAPELESINFVVIDETGTIQGQAILYFRSSFSTKPDMAVPFKVSVTYTTGDEEGGQKLEPVGAVGSLEGELLYQNLPAYAQMAGGCSVDGEVHGGHWLIEGLPYPQSMAQPPPLWREEYGALEALEDALQHPECEEDRTIDVDDLDDKMIFEALESIELPPPWEKRMDRAGDRPRVYFADPRSRRTTWKDPRFLPENWDQRIETCSGKVYWQYHRTKQHTHQDPRYCPCGWDMRLSKAGDIYFAFVPAMKTTFIDPRGLPEGMEAALDDSARMYFKNNHEHSTQWEDPRDEQQEVTLTTWRQASATRWWKEQVLKEIEDRGRDISRLDNTEVEEKDDEDGGDRS